MNTEERMVSNILVYIANQIPCIVFFTFTSNFTQTQV
jgi:hypothetical protein